jgi:hypothetical protein
MRFKLLLIATVVLATTVSSALAAPAPSKTDYANAQATCSALKSSMGAEGYTLTYGTDGHCVASWAAKARDLRFSARQSCLTANAAGTKLLSCTASKFGSALKANVSATKNASAACATDRGVMGDKAFATRYGTNANKSNAYGQCVSSHAKTALSGALTAAGTAAPTATYSVSVTPLNSSGVSGNAVMLANTNELTVTAAISGLQGSGNHAVVVTNAASCSAVGNNSSSTTFDLAGGESLFWLRPDALTGAPASLYFGSPISIASHAIVVYGGFVNGSYSRTAPVACGVASSG